MRRQHNARYADQRMVFPYRLAGEYIDCCTGYNPLLHGFGQIFFDDYAATGAVHEAHALFHLLHLLHANHALGVRRQRHMYRDEVRLGDNIIQCSYRYTQILGPVFIDIGVISDDIHIKGHGPFGHTRTDTAHADNAQRLVPQFHAHILLAIPLALLHGFIGNGNIAGHSQHHGHGMFRSGDGIAAGRVDDDNPLGRSSRNVDIIHADTSTADYLELLCPVDDFSRHLRGRTHHQCIILRNNFQQFLGGNLVPHIYFKLLLQKLNALGRNAISSQNLHIHRSL